VKNVAATRAIILVHRKAFDNFVISDKPERSLHQKLTYKLVELFSNHL